MVTAKKAWYEGYEACHALMSAGILRMAVGLPHGIKNAPANPYNDEPEGFASKVAPNINEVMSRWESEFQRVYDKQSAGDHTFYGMLSEFLREAVDEPTLTNRGK